jgi:Domain of unknown function (DUF4411)
MTGRYWVDANSFIWGSRDPYPMPGAMAYWAWFESMVDKGKIISHWKAIKEVTDGEGKGQHQEQIVSWVKTRKSKLVEPTPDSEECQKLVGELCQYSYQNFGPVKTVEFTKGADLFLIARAALDGGAVVTQESEKKLVRIPTVCAHFGVEYRTLFQMNHELKMKL